MDNWCFIDESWQKGADEHVGVLAAVVCPWSVHEALSREIFRVRRKYFGDENARDKKSELKGLGLLSNASFRMAQKHRFSKNHAVARELLEFANHNGIRIAAGAVYGDTEPPLLSPDHKLLAPPFKELCDRVWAQLPNHGLGNMVFDQRLGAQEDISIAVHNYLAGMAQPHRLRPVPLVAVSNVCAGLQLADIVAYIIGRYSCGDRRFLHWYTLVRRLQIRARDHRNQFTFGFFRQQWTEKGTFEQRTLRQKKRESGTSGKEAC